MNKIKLENCVIINDSVDKFLNYREKINELAYPNSYVLVKFYNDQFTIVISKVNLDSIMHLDKQSKIVIENIEITNKYVEDIFEVAVDTLFQMCKDSVMLIRHPDSQRYYRVGKLPFNQEEDRLRIENLVDEINQLVNEVSLEK